MTEPLWPEPHSTLVWRARLPMQVESWPPYGSIWISLTSEGFVMINHADDVKIFDDHFRLV